ncbi:hypothetical protein ACHAPA_009852 [Fusarium lateritium]
MTATLGLASIGAPGDARDGTELAKSGTRYQSLATYCGPSREYHYDAPVVSLNFSSGAISPSAFHSSGQSSALVSATSSGTLSSEEAPGTPATPLEDELNFYQSSDQELHDLQAVSCERAGLEKLKGGSSHATLPSSFGPSIGFDSEAPTVPLTWEDFEQWGKDHDDGDSYREGDLEKWCKTNFDFT